MKRLRFLLFCVIALTAIAGICAGDVPQIVYDGAALDHSGRVLGLGVHKVTFRVYDSPSADKPVWQEVIPAVQVASGRFHTNLGKHTPLELDWSKDYYISVQFGSGTENLRRQKLYRSTDERRAEGLGADIAYVVADAPLYQPIVGQSGCDMSVHPGGNWGAVIGSWRGVDANSNGQDTGNWSSLEPYCQDGYRYQCVEYPRKFYRVYMGMDTSQWFANGNQFYPKGPGWGLSRFANDGTSLPQADDILCFDGTTNGHVAVVTGATSSTVSIIQQNCSTLTAYLNLSVVNGIVQNYGTLYVQGWLRKPGYTVAPNTPTQTSPADAQVIAYGSSVTLTAHAAADGAVPDSYYFTVMDANGVVINTSGWVAASGSTGSYTPALSAGYTYKWKVKARHVSTESPETGTRTFSMNLPPNVTSAISPLDLEWVNSRSVTFSWNAAVDPFVGPSALTYNLYSTNPLDGRTYNVSSITTTTQVVTVPEDATFYWKVRSYDGLDWSGWSTERRVIVDSTACPPAQHLGPLKAIPNGPPAVLCVPITVTAGMDKFNGVFYVEEPDRSGALAVTYGTGGGPIVVTGDRLNKLKGVLGVSNGQRVLQSALVSGITHNSTVPDPVYVGSRDIGGGDLGSTTPGVLNGFGVNNLNLLVTIAGRVTYSDPGGAFFYVDDGAGMDDGSTHLGVRVMCTGLAAGNSITPPAQSKFVIVTGISATDSVLGDLVRCVRPRQQSDILPRP